MTHSPWNDAVKLLRERTALRTELARLRAENERLRGALVEEVSADVLHGPKHAIVGACHDAS